MSKTISLNGPWTIQQIDGDIQITGEVPGLVHHDLIAQGIVENPFHGMNELDQQWVGEQTWEYKRTFELDEKQAGGGAVVLNCDGLDTVADVSVNGHLVGTADNMFVRHRWDVREWVRPGTNVITIVFHPAREVMDERAESCEFDLGTPRLPYPWFARERRFLRKCQCHGGWDWGPCFLTQGIHRDIRLECGDAPRILYATHQQTHDGNGVDVTIKALIDAPIDTECDVTFTLADQSATRRERLAAGENEVVATLSLDEPKLWWPNGMGEQHLLDLTVSCDAGEDDVDSMSQRIGLRKLELVTERDDVGESFFFRVNDVPVYAKGNNWIPADSFDSRLDDEKIEWLLTSAKRAHNNIVRVWGGGIYERDRFYELCDEHGLLVWQDFMFACAHYPANQEFLDNVSAEVRHQVRRLNHHPSIALWCGNNEVLQSKLNPMQLVSFDDLFIKTIMPIVEAEDPGRRYWASSPCNGNRDYGDVHDQTRGDAHYWKVWHGGKPFSNYLTVAPRFCSEFGFQSFSSTETMNKVIPIEERNIASESYEFHQRSGAGNTTILSHISRHFRIPTSHEGMAYVSQALQALSIKTACEHWRRSKPRNMGAIIWQLNDIWPVASWASIEADGRWKLLHYAERHFFAPLLASTVAKDDHVELWVTSDVNEELNGELRYDLKSFAGEILKTETIPVSMPPLGNVAATRLPLDDLLGANDPRQTYLYVTARLNAFESANIHTFVPGKMMKLTKPDVTHDLREENGVLTMELTTRGFAPFTWLRHGDLMGTWSDNGIHLQAGETIELTFAPRGTTSPTLAQMREALTIDILYENGWE